MATETNFWEIWKSSS